MLEEVQAELLDTVINMEGKLKWDKVNEHEKCLRLQEVSEGFRRELTLHPSTCLNFLALVIWGSIFVQYSTYRG